MRRASRTTIFAVGQNYLSHLGERKVPSKPEIFYKPVSSLQDPDGPIVIPEDAEDVHFEGELVVVIGKTIRNASREEAPRPCVRRNLRQRCERPELAAGAGQGRAVLARQRLRHLRAAGSGDRHGTGLFESAVDHDG